jgi:hypothetical protein
VIGPSTVGKDETFMWPTAEKEERETKIKPLYIVIPLVVVALAAGAFFMFAGGGGDKTAKTTTTPTAEVTTTPTTTAKVTPTTTPTPAAELMVHGVAFVANGDVVRATLRLGGGKLPDDALFVKDARIADGKAVVELREPGITVAAAKSAGKGVTVNLTEGARKLVVSISADENKFSKMTAKLAPSGRAITLAFTVKPKPKPNPPPAVINPPPAVINPPPPVHPPPPPSDPCKSANPPPSCFDSG